MAITLHGTPTKTGPSTVNSLSVSIGSPSNGDVVIVLVGPFSTSARTITPPTGWTLVPNCSNSTSLGTSAVYYYVWQTGNSTSYAFGISGTNASMTAVAALYSGVNGVTGPIDASISNQDASTNTTHTALSVTAKASSDMLLMIYQASAAVGAFTAPSKGTIELTTASSFAFVDFLLSSGGATGNQTITTAATGRINSYTVTLWGSTSYTQGISESISKPTDAVVRSFIGARGESESIVNPSDSTTRIFVGSRNNSESITIPSDSVSRTLIITKGISENINIPTDLINRIFVGARALPESITIPTDLINRIFVGARALPESISIPSDSVSRTLIITKGISENINIPSSLISRGFIGARGLPESISIPSDSVSRSFTLAKNISESIAIPSDSIARVFVGSRVTVETIDMLSDSIDRIFIGSRGNFESITIPTDLIDRIFVGSRNNSESILIPTDDIARMFIGFRGQNEDVPVPIDSVIGVVSGQKTINIFEEIDAPTDSIIREVLFSRNIMDDVGLISDMWDHTIWIILNKPYNYVVQWIQKNFIQVNGHDPIASPIVLVSNTNITVNNAKLSPVQNVAVISPANTIIVVKY